MFPPMDAEWYYQQHGQNHGPVTWDRLQRLAAEGRLLPDQLIWKEGMPEWKPVREFSELVSAANRGATRLAETGTSGAASPSSLAGIPPPLPSSAQPSTAQRGSDPYAARTTSTRPAPQAGFDISQPPPDGLLVALGSLVVLIAVFLPWFSTDYGNTPAAKAFDAASGRKPKTRGDSESGVQRSAVGALCLVGALTAAACCGVYYLVPGLRAKRAAGLTFSILFTLAGSLMLVLCIIYLAGEDRLDAEFHGVKYGPSYGAYVALLGAGLMVAGGVVALVDAIRRVYFQR
jgi:hypothetical protein